MKSVITSDGKIEPPESLDSDSLAALEEGIRSEQTARDFTWEEVKKHVRERRKAWKTVPNSIPQ